MHLTRFATSLGILATAFVALADTARAGGGNAPPSFTGGGITFVECNGQGSPTVHVLDIGAFDPDGDPLTFQWSLTGSCAAASASLDDPTLEHPAVSYDMNGTCFAECGGIKVSISDGINPPVEAGMAIFIEDTMPPTIAGPADIFELEMLGCPEQMDTSLTGVPTGSDTCDPNPTITLISEVFTSPVGPPWGTGIECIVDRVWEIEDCEGLTAQVSQNVTIVGPAFFNASTAVSDIGPGECPNYVDVTGQSANTIDMTVFGSQSFNVKQIKARKLSLARVDGVGGSVAPIGFFASDFGTGDDNPCHPVSADGYLDVLFVFDENQVAKQLQLDQFADGQVVMLQLKGTQWSGAAFTSQDVVLVQK